jgi:hypothetical protein
MKRTLLPIMAAAIALVSTVANAQVRYLDQIFSTNQVTNAVPFGFNFDPLRSNTTDLAAFQADMVAVNALIAAGEQVPLNYFLSNSSLPAEQHTALKLFPLEMDVYTPPAEDTESSRPLIVYLHTGNFLPPVINGGPTGSRKDSVVVNLCKQWARKGYVVAAISYRLGWNPVSSDQDVRTGTLLQAVYRALHDAQTGVRFMRASAAQGNPYGIDPSKIVLFGQGSGGYVAQAYTTLSDYNTEIAIPKFIGENGLPYVLEARDGNIDGGPGATRLPDPLQQAGIPKDVSMSINIGGALADISWLEEGDVPMVTLHCVRDPFAPFDDGTVVVPTTNEDVVDVSGGNVFIQQAVDFGNNALFSNIPDGNDPYTDRARSLYGQTFDYILASQPTITVSENPEGLFPIVLPINTINGNRFTNQGGPWDWWDFATLQAVVAATNDALGLTGTPQAYNADVIHAQSLAGNPGMGLEKGLTYIDTIQGYVNPRIMCALSLPENPCALSVGEQVLESSTTIFPNPSRTGITIQNNEYPIRRVEIIDITGRRVAEKSVNANMYFLDRGGLADGVYLMQIVFDNERITKKVVFN